MRKKLLFGAVCIVVLLVAAGAYAYTIVNSGKGRTFNFEWFPLTQNVTSGFLQMDLTFTFLDKGNLSIVVKINDDEYNGSDYLGIAHVEHEAGGLGWMFYASNLAHGAAIVTSNGFMDYFILYPTESKVHTCSYNEEGYTFLISLPPPEEPSAGDLIHVCFYDAQIQDGVFITFHLGLTSDKWFTRE